MYYNENICPEKDIFKENKKTSYRLKITYSTNDLYPQYIKSAHVTDIQGHYAERKKDSLKRLLYNPFIDILKVTKVLQ